jgi:hypothetical protein
VNFCRGSRFVKNGFCFAVGGNLWTKGYEKNHNILGVSSDLKNEINVPNTQIPQKQSELNISFGLR